MSRLIFGGDLAYNGSVPGTPILNAGNDIITVYRDAAATTVETDLQTYPGSVAITNGVLGVTAYSGIPLFYGPASGADILYVVINGGPITPIYAQATSRIEDLATSIASEATTARANETLLMKPLIGTPAGYPARVSGTLVAPYIGPTVPTDQHVGDLFIDTSGAGNGAGG